MEHPLELVVSKDKVRLDKEWIFTGRKKHQINWTTLSFYSIAPRSADCSWTCPDPGYSLFTFSAPMTGQDWHIDVSSTKWPQDNIVINLEWET